MDTSISSSSSTSGIGKLILILLGIFAVLFLIFFIVRGIVRSISAVFSQSSITASTTTNQTSEPAIIQTQEKIIITRTSPLLAAPNSVDEIKNDPSQFLGQKVTVNGYVGRHEKPWGFILEEDGKDSGQMLIITLGILVSQDIKDFEVPAENEQHPVEVTGTVKLLTYESTLEFGLTQDDFRKMAFNDQYVIVPDEIKRL